jgi:O-antigen/teichoic acid export membrane protein
MIGSAENGSGRTSGVARDPRLSPQLLSTAAAEAFSFICAFAFSVIATRALQPAGKGMFATAQSILLIAGSVAALGLTKSLIYSLNRPGVPRGRLLGAAVALLAPMSVLGLAILVGVSFATFETPHGRALVVMSCILPVVLATNLLDGLLYADRQIGVVNLATVIQNLASVVFIGLAVLLFDFGYRDALVVVLGAWCVRAAVLLLGAWRRTDCRVAWTATWTAGLALLRFGVVYQAAYILWTAHVRVDVLMVNALASAESGGIYATGANLAQMMWRVPTILGLVMVPFLARQDSDDAALRHAARMCRMTWPVVVGAALVLWLAAEWLVTLFYTESFRASAGPLRLLLPGVVASAQYLNINAFLASRNRLRVLVGATAASFALNIALNYWLIPILHENGAAIASAISYSVLFVLAWFGALRGSSLAVRDFLLLRRDDLGLVRALFRPRAAGPSGALP